MSLTKVSYSMITGAPANVLDFGADATGVSDSAAAIQSAMSSGKPDIYFPAGTYKIGSTINIPTSVKAIRGAGKGSTIIDASSSSGNITFDWIGTGFTQIANLGSNVVVGDSTITFASDMSSVLSEGDVFVIWNSTNGSFNPARTAYYAGEYCEVYTVSTTTVTVKNAAFASYNTGDVGVFKLNDDNVTGEISGMTFLGDMSNAVSIGIRIRKGRNITVQSVELKNYYRIGIELEQIYEAKAFNVNASVWPDPVTGLQYGIVCANCQNVQIIGCNLTTARHAVSTGGSAPDNSTDVRPVDRGFLVKDNILTGYLYALDCHGNMEYAAYEQNTVYGGVLISGNNIRVVNNTITKLGFLAGIRGNDLVGADILIDGNTIIGNLDGGVTNIQMIDIDYELTTASYGMPAGQLLYRVPGTTIVRNNVMKITNDYSVGTKFSIIKQTGVTTPVHVVVQNNQITAPLNASGVYGINMILIDQADSGYTADVIGNRLYGGCLRMEELSDTRIIENWVFDDSDSNQSGINWETDYGAHKCSVLRNEIKAASYFGIRLTTAGSTTAGKVYEVFDNIAFGSGQSGSPPSTPVTDFYIDHASGGNGALAFKGNYFNSAQMRFNDATYWESWGQETNASAATVSFTLPTPIHIITGTTNIDTINFGQNTPPVGHITTLKFNASLTVNDGTGNLKLAGNFSATADDTLMIMWDGTNWVEVSRSAN